MTIAASRNRVAETVMVPVAVRNRLRLDIGLPGMDGYELARRLRATCDGIRLIAVTGYGLESDRERSAGAGFDDHLVKPIDLAELARALAPPGSREEPTSV